MSKVQPSAHSVLMFRGTPGGSCGHNWTSCVSPTDAQASPKTVSRCAVMCVSSGDQIQDSLYLPPGSCWSVPASLWRHRGARVSAHHTSALHLLLLLTHPSICALCPPHPPSFPCVEAAFTAQHSRLFLHLFPSRLLFLCLKGRFAVSMLHCHSNPFFFSFSLSHLVLCPVFLKGQSAMLHTVTREWMSWLLWPCWHCGSAGEPWCSLAALSLSTLMRSDGNEVNCYGF